ncbi:MAG: DUF262 domain-containing protein [Spirochaetia bacterium]|nr:DUF262 domain-containing protein [Spirochaetia bacterium]
MRSLENPRIRAVGDLLNENFYIPRYQRGFRWEKQEITELLDDIMTYHESVEDSILNKKVGDFYCIQPIVVKQKRWRDSNNDEIEGWELIDGQQRLTAIYIILSYLEDVREHYDNSKKIYRLDFETRINCKDFFEGKRFTGSIDESNVDFYHISKAYNYVKKWFEDKQIFRIEILKRILGDKKNVSVIWYETKIENVDEDNSSIELFTRLNEGKIPLTDAELIKALILQSDIYNIEDKPLIKQRLFEIATEWDEIEAKFQNELFWGFLNDEDYKPSSKIEFLFKILSDKWNDNVSRKLIYYEKDEGKPKHFEFLVFSKYLEEIRNNKRSAEGIDENVLSPINEIWQQVKDLFTVFYEWYLDQDLYHYIGYLLLFESNRDQLIRKLIYTEYTKKIFKDKIQQRIADLIKIEKVDKETGVEKKLNQLCYNEDNKAIIKILLLFNIESLINNNNEYIKFPFHLYKKQKIYSIEHIHPQNSLSFNHDEVRSTVWLKNHKQSLELLEDLSEEEEYVAKEIVQSIDNIVNDYDKDKFKTLYDKILDFYTSLNSFNDNKMHTLYNLALIDKDTNSELNNSFYDIKRQILRENKSNKYIPICTQRVFSKYYSKNPKELIFWNENDMISYYESIESIYNLYMLLLEVDNENK